MRYLKTYQLFESKTAGLTKRQEQFLNKYTRGTWTYNSSTGLVNVDGDFDCGEQGLSDFKGVRFGKVGGDFSCRNNQLTSLEGAPQEVGWGFYCDNNQLTTLVGAPREVGEDFYCDDNQLTTLEGAPLEVRGIFSCADNQLTTLDGAPQKVGGYFYCTNNQLTSLEGAPQQVGGDFYCDAFTLESGEWNLEGWLSVLKEGSPEAQQLIATILSPEDLNREIQKDPAGMIMKLKPVWNDESFRETRDKLIWPQGYEEEMEIVGGLNTIGF